MKRDRLTGSGWLFLSTALLLLDVISKYWAENTLRGNGRQVVIRGILGFRYAQNTGAAFNALSGATVFLSLLSIVLCVAVAFYMFRKPSRWYVQLSLSMILAGGLGNLLDRLIRGYVVDYLEFLFVNFAIFNMADVYITIGTTALAFTVLRGGDKIGGMGHK